MTYPVAGSATSGMITEALATIPGTTPLGEHHAKILSGNNEWIDIPAGAKYAQVIGAKANGKPLAEGDASAGLVYIHVPAPFPIVPSGYGPAFDLTDNGPGLVPIPPGNSYDPVGGDFTLRQVNTLGVAASGADDIIVWIFWY